MLGDDTRRCEKYTMRDIEKIKREREEGIEHFKKVHGNHSNEVFVTIDVDAMKKLIQEHYKDRITMKQLKYYGLTE